MRLSILVMLIFSCFFLGCSSNIRHKAYQRAELIPYANLSDADLANDDLTGTNLRGANLAGANLSKAILKSVDLSQINWAGANFSGAVYNDETIFPEEFDPKEQGMLMEKPVATSNPQEQTKTDPTPTARTHEIKPPKSVKKPLYPNDAPSVPENPSYGSDPVLDEAEDLLQHLNGRSY